jgi:trehalose synthase-fused probable maltokinase
MADTKQNSLLEKLPAFLAEQRWFGGKARGVRSVEILDWIPMCDERVAANLALIDVRYSDAYPDETYALPLTAGDEPRDALRDPGFLTLLLKSIEQGRIYRGEKGEVFSSPSSAYRRSKPAEQFRAKLVSSEQSNSSVIFENLYILKLLRQAGEGINPELEIGTFLTERARFPQVPAVTGSMIYRGHNGGLRTLGILQSFIANQGNAWEYTLEELAAYFARLSQAQSARAIAEGDLGSYLQAAELLGRRTADLHLALASDSSDPDFAPEPFSEAFRQAFRISAREQCARVFQTLERQPGVLPSDARPSARRVHDLRNNIEDRLQAFGSGPEGGARIRIHGDYHLGQVLCANRDFVIIDFEGEPARPLAERRSKQSPLQDVAGMLRSFHYAAIKGMRDWLARPDASSPPASGGPAIGGSECAEWARFWKDNVSRRFLTSYLAAARSGRFLPDSAEAVRSLLDAYLLSKAIYELGYELNNRPDWVIIPLAGILDIMGG